MKILLTLIFVNTISAVAIASESYSCKAFEHQPPEHKDIKVFFKLITCKDLVCAGDLNLYFKKTTIFAGAVTLKKATLTSPNSIVTVYENRSLNTSYGGFHFVRETFLDEQQDFIYGEIKDVSDNFETVNFECKAL